MPPPSFDVDEELEPKDSACPRLLANHSIVEDRMPIEEYAIDARRCGVTGFIRVISHSVPVEYDHVSSKTLFQKSSIAETKSRGGRTGHLVHGCFER